MTQAQAVAGVRDPLGTMCDYPTRAAAQRGGKPRAESASAERFGLMRTASGLLWDRSAGPKQPYRVVHCQRSMLGDLVGVYRAQDGSRGSFTGLMTCGSVWHCPVCAHKVAEGRAGELRAAHAQHVKAGGRVVLMTYTFPHERDEPLADLVAKLDQARQRFKNSRTYKRTTTAAGRIGSVCAAEVTYGGNGWHPHLHELTYQAREFTAAEAEELRGAWVRICLKVGLADQSDVTDLALHGLDIRGGDKAADYVHKFGKEERWGVSSEVTGLHAKRAGQGHYKPFNLLALARAGEQWARERFTEYAHVFHAKRWVTWSPGLRRRFDLAEVEDQELAELPERDYVGKLTADQWRAVLRADAQAEILEYAAQFCIDPGSAQADLDDFVRHLEGRPRRARGWFAESMGEWRPGVGWVRLNSDGTPRLFS